ncbi:MAG: Ribonuclease [Humibacillus sp.]|nr:Ribonuclease [Humibacillus sp.]
MSPAAPTSRRDANADGRRRLVIEADGGSRGNPGVAGYGALVRDPSTGTVLVELAEPLGKESNNVAEYSGLIAGLKAVVDLDPSAEVVAKMDSKLVVEQMSGRWKIKHEDMRRLALEARDLCAEIGDAGGSVSFQWIPREKNRDADKLSNDAMDGLTIRRVLHEGDVTTHAAQGDSSAVEMNDAQAAGNAAATAALPAKPLRLLLVQAPLVDGAVPRVAAAVRRLVGGTGRASGTGGTGLEIVTSGEPLALDVARAVAAELKTEPADLADTADMTVSAVWAAGAPGEHTDDRVRAAYRSLVSTGGTVVVVTTRRGVLSVLADVLETPGPRFWALATAPGSLTAVEVWEDGSVTVAFTNRTEHLA